jgi:hypothetical protein
MDGELAKILTSGKPEETRVQSRQTFRWLDSTKKSKYTESQQLAVVLENVDRGGQDPKRVV